ncbi:MAG: signal peptidase II [Clostridiales bacterium]|nr:signal peptidase II [Clostridiales bacterium]
MIIGVITILDQFIKMKIVDKVMPHKSIEIIKNFFYLTYVENTGISFGMFKGKRIIFIILTIIVCIILSYFLIKFSKTNRVIAVCLAFIIGGAIGNLIDRIRLGYVIDYIHFSFFPPVFNLADAAIVCGAIALSIILIFNKNIEL